MSAGPWQIYDQFMLEKSNGTQDLDTDIFKVILMLSTYTPDLAADVTYVGIGGDEVATNFGYTQGGKIVAATLTKTSGNINFSSANVDWTASGGSVVCRYAVTINSTTGGLVAYSLLDVTPDDITLTNTNTLTLNISVNDIFDETRV